MNSDPAEFAGEARHTRRGKWSAASVPHRGWTCVDVEDLEEPSQFCEMCESAEIRYVHYMAHPDYPETLGVGCICAEHMENDYVNPRLREKKLRAVSRRRPSWARRQWKTSGKGNFYINTEGYNITVFKTSDPKGSCWGLCVTHRESGATRFGQRRYRSADDAKKAGLDALIWAKSKLGT